MSYLQNTVSVIIHAIRSVQTHRKSTVRTRVTIIIASECKLTEVRIRPLPLPVVFVMNSELCDFRVTKQPCDGFEKQILAPTVPRCVHASDVSFEICVSQILRWSRVYLAIKTVETAPVFV